MHARLGGCGHEVGVVAPAGDEVHMEMLLNPGARCRAKIDPDVESVRLERRRQRRLQRLQHRHHLQRLVVAQVFQRAGFAIGDDHEVAAIIGIDVKYGETALAAEENMVGFIVGAGRDPGEDVPGNFLWVLHVKIAPRRPEMFHWSSVK